MMDHAYIDQNQIAERYLLGKLSTAEAERFEEHSMSCDECLDRLEVAERLGRGLSTVAARAAEERQRQVATAVGVGLLARLVRARHAGLLLTCLLVAFLLPTGVLWWQLEETRGELARLETAAPVDPAPSAAVPRQSDGRGDDGELDALRQRLAEAEGARDAERRRADQGAASRERLDRLERELEAARRPQINVPLLTLGPERSAATEASARIDLSAPSAPTQVLVSLEADGSGPYRVALVGASGDVLWRADGLVPDDTGFLNLTVPTALLGAGDHGLRLTPPGSTGATGATGATGTTFFPFRVVR